MSNTDRSGASSADVVGQDRDWQAVREEIGLTRQELAAKLGTNHEAIRRWEDGQQSPSIAYQRQISDLREEYTPPICGCLGCRDDADAVIDHPDHGRRTVCGAHAHGYEVVERV